MRIAEPGPITREELLRYFVQAAKPRNRWRVGMEVERMGRDAKSGLPLPYEDEGPSIRKSLEAYRARRGGDPILEGDHLIGLDAPWGSITLEPGGQFEWSSRPRESLEQLATDLDDHTRVLELIGRELGIEWLQTAVDPTHPLSAMPWMPKARYQIMRPFLAARGRLAPRMMTQTASIQCAFDYSDPTDWRRKFLAATVLAPVTTALFANSPCIDGEQSGYLCYRQAIWAETDGDRCGIPPVVFEESFDLERWLDWILQVPTIFRHRARGLVPAGGVPFREVMGLGGCDAIQAEDWETHVSTIFTEVRSYTYLEVRSADLQPTPLTLAVPAFWTGLLYDDGALSAALELGSPFASHPSWKQAIDDAARSGLDSTAGGHSLRSLAREALRLARGGLEGGAVCVGDSGVAVAALERLDARHGLSSF